MSFTLLELIVVIIIIGVLAALALPKLWNSIELARGTEATAMLGTIRAAIERCYLWEGKYEGCTNFSSLDLEDPNSAPNTHFDYSINTYGEVPFENWEIRAIRNTRNGGDDFGEDHIVMYDTPTGEVRLVGYGVFKTINE